jgi:hypothetical protein
MLSWVVGYRLRPLHSWLSLPVHATPLFPSTPVSPLFPIRCSHTCTTATAQLFCHQSVTHSFPRDGGVYPLSSFHPSSSPSSAQNLTFPVVDPHSIQQLAKCSSRNSLLLLLIHFDGGGTPSPTYRRPNTYSSYPPVCAEWYTLPRVSGPKSEGPHES